jgi:DMSO/TMAO reductase YedYZ molybdopterin-dependent catalytic subunit
VVILTTAEVPMKNAAQVILLCLIAAGCGAHGAEPIAPPAEPGESGGADGSASLEIAGLVKTPTTFSVGELRRLEPVSVRATEVRRGGEFFGAYTARGAPLRALLDTAAIRKGPSAFDKPLDLAIVVTGASGRRAVFSWGEVYYRNPSEVIVAFESKPVIPHKSCDRCHGPEVFAERLEATKRALGFPKLIATRDLWGDRAVERIAKIEVVEPLPGDPAAPPVKREGHEKLWSEAMTIAAPGKPALVIPSLDGYSLVAVDAIMAGEGIGFHGARRFEGAALSEVLSKAGIAPDPATAILLSAPDGYRVLLSSAEVFDAADGPTVILADTEDGAAIDDGGRFHLVLPGDQAADRWLKSVSRVDVVKL